MQDDIEATLSRVFGYSTFRPGQKATVEAVLAGRSAAAIFPTGSGKSLCYQLPALHLPALTLVVSPLLALMQDQLAFLADNDVAAASIDSTQTPEQARDAMHAVRDGRVRILMISVERLKNERFRNFIRQVPISLMVIDEAHCISEWGHNFRPDYLKLPIYQRELGIPQVLLLTATATPRVIADMQARFDIAETDVIRTGVYRRNLHLAVEGVHPDDKLERLVEWLGSQRDSAGIVYVTLQRTAERIAAQLRRRGIDAHAYHAGMKSEDRDAVQRRFMDSATGCVVATIAFGMGIDKRDIRYVVHYDLPKSIENYSQEIGRAGRDDRGSRCLVLADRDGLHVLENFVYGDTPERHGIGTVLNEVAEVVRAKAAGTSDGDWEVSLTGLSQRADIRTLPLKTLLVQLELRGVIAPKYTYFSEYRFKYLIEPDQLVSRFRGERRRFVQALVDHAQRRRVWATLDFDGLYQSYRGIDGNRAPRSRVLSALDYFVEQGWIELEAKQSTDVYQVSADHLDIDELTAALHDDFVRSEQGEIERVASMLAFFESDACLWCTLGHYFGDDAAPARCEHCSVCDGRIAQVAPATPLPPLGELSFDELAGEVIESYRERLGRHPSSEAVTRFLCGVVTPALSQLRVRRMRGFGRLEPYRYGEVRRWCQDR